MKNRNQPEIDKAVANGIRKTINRFRERPFFYFTEADIHASLVKDITAGNKKDLHFNTVARKYDSKGQEVDQMNLFVSLVHQEYPTNFRYKKNQLLKGYHGSENKTCLKKGLESNKHGDRGNFDIAILNIDYLDTLTSIYRDKKLNKDGTIISALRNIINKDNELAKYRYASNEYFKEELLYVMEVKFLHLFNSRNKSLLEEVVKDNEKLRLAAYHTEGFVKPINLIFCSSNETQNRKRKGMEEESVITKVQRYIEDGKIKDYDGKEYKLPPEVLNIFVNSFIKEDDLSIKKETPKTVVSEVKSNSDTKWAQHIKEVLKTK